MFFCLIPPPLFCFICRGVFIGKNDPPGKLCNKDIVAEAAEAWSTLQKQRRKEGLYRRSSLPPPVAAADTAMDVSADNSAATTQEAQSGPGPEEEDISFVSTKNSSSRSTADALSQDSDSDESDDQLDLAALPSLGELEESVDIPFSAMFEQSAADAALPANSAVPAKGAGSRSGSGRSRKSNSHADADDLAPGSSSSNYFVPGVRKGTFVPASGPNGIYFAPEREDKRLYYATPEELLRYRAGVEYVLPEDVTLEDFKNCVEEGKFKTSRCPLPLPTLQSEMDCSDEAKAPLMAGKDLKGELL